MKALDLALISLFAAGATWAGFLTISPHAPTTDAAREPLAQGAGSGSREIAQQSDDALEPKPPRPLPQPPPAANPSPQPARDAAGDRRILRDCPACPELVVIPAGGFEMGASSAGAESMPVRRVTIARPLAVGRYEVTFREWDACAADGSCDHRPTDYGWGRERRPVVNVSWSDAARYASWLSRKTGKTYRLLSEAEWEYATQGARGHEQTIAAGSGKANCSGCGSSWDNRQTAPVGSFAPNGHGLFDTLGNVWEWVEDCWTSNLDGIPGDGSARVAGDCNRRVLRGGSWNAGLRDLSSAKRLSGGIASRDSSIGFRVARQF